MRPAVGLARDVGLALVSLVALAAVALALLTVRVDGLSMLPTLQDGDALIADRFLLPWQSPHRGDLVVLLQPNGVAVVKRVIAVPGDTIEISDRTSPPGVRPSSPVVAIRPGGRGPWRRLVEPYVEPGWVRLGSCCDAQGRAVSGEPRPLNLPPGQYFVLGDNRNASLDSREFGLVPRSRIVGLVLARYWPLDRAGALTARPRLAAA
ncbi:MAG TPA: signal peptidase I [Candidatus Dormibacteraeota bacterium]|nr:signal peptidase I [Candidatus Dormibacteraeota bacterium]